MPSPSVEKKKSDDIRETKYEYDGKNQLISYTDPEGRTETYTYNAYGDVATQDDTTFTYDDVSGQVTKETTKLTKNKDVVKNYTCLLYTSRCV